MDVDTYLKRINCDGLKQVSYENLKTLQLNHIESIPFENFDIHLGKHIDLSLEKLYDKIIKHKRGGYCFEMNALFGWLIGKLGYQFHYNPTYIYKPHTRHYFPRLFHMCLIVNLDGKKYFVDVATMRISKEPLELVENKNQKTICGTYRFINEISDNDEYYILERIKNDAVNDEWFPQVRFSLTPYNLEQFYEMNEASQTNEHPYTFHHTGCCIHTRNGIKFLIGWKFIEYIFDKDNEYRNEKILTTEQVKMAIKEIFEIEIDIDSLVIKYDVEAMT